MAKAAIVILADTETHGDMARVVNALEAVKEFKEGGDDVKLYFDGAGTRWVAALAKPDNRLKGLYDGVKDKVAGACSFCAGAFGASEAVDEAGIAIGEFEGYPSFRKMVLDGYQVITF